MLVYGNDIVIASNNIASINHLKSILSAKFKIIDLGDLKFFLGIEVARTTKRIHLC